MKLKSRHSGWDICALFFLLSGMFIVASGATRWFAAIPGEMLDARFNNVLLEHLYLWTRGFGNFWSPAFFFPYEHVLAFSDDHLGSGEIYILGRWLGIKKEWAFDLWFLAAYPLNFLSAWYVLKKFGFTSLSSAIGAFVFTFSLPVFGQANHSQLGYRFAIPMAFLWLERGLSQREWGMIASLGFFLFWVTWQCACSIYLGVFLCIIAVFWIAARITIGWRVTLQEVIPTERPRQVREYFGILAGVFSMAALAALLIPYAIVSREYHFVRQDWEICSMVPRIGSYLVADNSWFSGEMGKWITDLPMRNEHQLFLGFLPCLLLMLGLLRRRACLAIPKQKLIGIAAVTLLFILILSTVVGGKSFYFLFIHLPLVNALRSVSRIELVCLFPVAIICAGGAEAIVKSFRHVWVGNAVLLLLSAGLVLEVSHFEFSTVSIQGMNERIAALRSLLPAKIAPNGILFLEKDPKEGDYVAEVDAMVLAQELGIATWNGYSGNVPPGHGDGRSFSDAIRQMAVYCKFRGYGEGAYHDLVSRVVPVRCYKDPKAMPLHSLPEIITTTPTDPKEGYAAVSISLKSMTVEPGNIIRLSGVLYNGSKNVLRSVSVLQNPTRFTWRWVALNESGEDTTYSMRSDLSWDVAAGDSESFTLDLQPPQRPGLYRVELTLLQERRSFLDHHGMLLPSAPYWLRVTPEKKLELVEAAPLKP